MTLAISFFQNDCAHTVFLFSLDEIDTVGNAYDLSDHRIYASIYCFLNTFDHGFWRLLSDASEKLTGWISAPLHVPSSLNGFRQGRILFIA
jgi:hypothetical protein